MSPPAPAVRRSRPLGGRGGMALGWGPRAGVTNVAPRVMDGEQLDVEEGFFDAVICRLGFMYFPEQQAAFAGMRRALKPDGRLPGGGVSTPGLQRVVSVP